MPDTNTMPESNTNTMDIQKVWNFDLGTLIRREELNGRQYIVVPMVMILEGVHVGSQGPVYYSLDELAKTPKQWNMKPIVIEHRLPMEVSTGLFSELVMESGTWNGEEYKGKIINIRADHLAILPKKQGACSLSDGAGLLINQSYANNDSNTKGDTLNIISKVINQTFPPGSNVVMDYDLDVETGKKQPEEVVKEKQEKDTQDKKTEEKKKEKIENAIKPEVFMTADGNKITYEAAGNGTLEIEKPDFGSADEKKEEPEEIKVEPIQDNPVNVEVKPRIGRSEFEELLADLAVKAERVRSYQERHTKGTRNNKALYNAKGGLQSTKGTFKTLTRDKLEWTGELKSLTDSLLTIEQGLSDMYTNFREQLRMAGIEEEDIPFNLTGFQRFLDYIVRYKNALQSPDIREGNLGSAFNEMDNYLMSLSDEELDEMYSFVRYLYDCEKGVVSDSVELMQYLMSNQIARTLDAHKEYEKERIDLKEKRGTKNKTGIPPTAAQNPMLGSSVFGVYDKKYPQAINNPKTDEDDENNFVVMVRDLLGAASAVCKGIIFAEDDYLASYWTALEDIINTYGLDEFSPRLRVLLDMYKDKAKVAIKKMNGQSNL